jgi:hypothetical protein
MGGIIRMLSSHTAIYRWLYNKVIQEQHQNHTPSQASVKNRDKKVQTLHDSAMAPPLDIYTQDREDQPLQFHLY